MTKLGAKDLLFRQAARYKAFWPFLRGGVALLALFLVNGCSTVDPGRASLSLPLPTSPSSPELASEPQPAAALTGNIVATDAPTETDFSIRDCPPISDDARIEARVSASDSGAPRTQHPGLDLYVRDGAKLYVVRVHFGDLGDGMNVCLPFDECKNMRELPGMYSVPTRRVKELFSYLKARDYCVGKFCSWGVPVLPWPATGSNCGDAFVQAVVRLGLAQRVLPEMRQWIKSHPGGFWAFERGWRRPVDDFFRAPSSIGEPGNAIRRASLANLAKQL